MSDQPDSAERRLLEELEELRRRLDEPQQTFDAIRQGAVDAFVVTESDGERVYALQDVHPMYQLIVEGMREGAAIIAREQVVTYCNPQFARLVGLSRNAILGHPMNAFLAPQSRDVFLSSLQAGEESPRVTVHLQAGEETVPVQITASTLATREGVNYCLIITDLREHTQREELRAAKEAAEQANRAKDEFLATLSHEVRTPITAILGWIRMMQMGLVEPSTLRTALESMQHSTMTLVGLVDDLLDISRLSSGKFVLETEATDLAEVVRAAVEATSLTAEQKRVELVVTELPPGIIIQGDRKRLQQVFSNILSNAVKFTPPLGRVSLDVTKSQGRVVVRVVDTGEGIATEFLPHIFERFRQADTSTTRSHGGLGLGLSIVHQLVTAHGGQVTASSDGRGCGATLSVELPIVESVPLAAMPRLPERIMPSLDGVKVLIVEDDSETRHLLVSIVESCGATVVAAATAGAAVGCFSELQPDVVVTDLAMPEQDGIALLRQLRALRKGDGKLAAIALSAHATDTHRDRLLSAGFRSYLRKPVEPFELASAILQLARPA
jgi:PAS domain S-box-containing protein